MSKLIIKGNTKVNGEIKICGSKNSILPILACTLLTDKTVRITNCPKISDVDNMLKILESLGGKCYHKDDALYVSTKDVNSYTMPTGISGYLRSSIFMLGPILARFKKVCCVYPGGCEIGNRPIDLHLQGLTKLNVEVKEENGSILCFGENMQNAELHLDYPSVGATENLMMAAAGISGNHKTIITNAAREPEIEDLQAFMRKIGVVVSGAGTSTIEICGRNNSLCFGEEIEHEIIPDRIVSGTMLCAAAISGGSITLNNVIPANISSLLSKLKEAGCDISVTDSEVYLKAPKRLSEIRLIETLPHPGFPTDMQAPMFALCTVAEGTSIIVENVFENRFKHAPEFIKMGAIITQRDRTAVIRGVKQLSGANVSATDLRAGAALVIAGLSAKGYTEVDNAEYIDRGYPGIENMLNSLGASIIRV